MNTPLFHPLIKAAVSLAALLLSASAILGQGTLTLVGSSIRNGSFEDGSLAPWESIVGNPILLQNADLASHGEWFATLSQHAATGPVLRPSMFQDIPATPTNGLTFIATFDARSGTAGFERTEIGFNAQNGDGTLAFFAHHAFESLTHEWQSYQMEFHIPPVWDGGGGVRLGLGFGSSGASIGTTYTAYLDNVVLQQVPEPATWTFLTGGLCAACVVIRLFRKRRLNLVSCSFRTSPVN